MNWRILYKYVEGTCSEQELKQLGTWLQENPANEDFFKTFIEQAAKGKDVNFEVDAREAWDKFREKYRSSFPENPKAIIHEFKGTDKKQHSDLNRIHKRNMWYWYYMTAAIMLIAALFFSIQIIHPGNKVTRKFAGRVITTTRGERINLELKDGTHVVLNSESELRIPKNYGNASRTIYLKGEAFFKVKFEKKHPFMVVVHHSFIKDLGTQFNVFAYDSARIMVAVKEGLVSMGEVRQGDKTKELGKVSPNKLGILKDTGKFTVSNIKDISKYTGWTEGKLVFWKTPFPEVVKRLQRWYGIDCKISDPELAKRTLTATYDNLSENEVLKVLSLSMNITYSRHNNTIIFRNK